MKVQKKIFLLILNSVFLFACNQGGNKRSSFSDSSATNTYIQKPLENIDIAFEEYLFRSNSSQTIKTASGTEIIIPENIFEDADGKPVSGEIKLNYREIKSAAEVIASGITMQYDSAGAPYDFQTAGMFEIKGFANGKPVFIQKGKAINVKFASNATGDYNFYQMDAERGDWIFQGHGTKAENSSNEDAIKELEKLEKLAIKPIEPVPLDPKKDLVIEIKANYKKFPELSVYKGFVWKYCGDENIKTIQNQLAENWTKTELQELDKSQLKYTLILSNAGKNLKLPVSPVFNGKNLEQAKTLYTQKLQQFENAKKELARLEAENCIVRAFPVTTFGLFNWDKIYMYPEKIVCSADFVFGQRDKELYKDNISVFLISGENNVIVRYTKNNFKNFMFSPGERNKIVALLPDKKIATLSSADFQKIAYARTQQGEMQNLTFQLTEQIKPVEDIKSLDNIISNL